MTLSKNFYKFRKIVRYNDFKEPLIPTDLDIIKKKTLKEEKGILFRVIDQRLLDGKNRALIIKFTLPQSAYATMFIRELTHSSSIQDWASINE